MCLKRLLADDGEGLGSDKCSLQTLMNSYLNLSVIEWKFSFDCVKKKDGSDAMNQLELKHVHVTGIKSATRCERKSQLVFGFTCDWLRDWQTQNCFLTLSQQKTAL